MGKNYNLGITFSSSCYLSEVTPTTILPFSNQEAKIYVYVASKPFGYNQKAHKGEHFH